MAQMTLEKVTRELLYEIHRYVENYSVLLVAIERLMDCLKVKLQSLASQPNPNRDLW